MGNPAATMKVGMTMDNSDLKKKSRESKEALRDFQKTGTDAVNKLGEAFGVNTGKVGQLASSLEGLGVKLQQSSNAGTKAFGSMVSSIGGVTKAFAGIGITAAVASFKLLNEEATAFKNTVAGANIELQTTAYIQTYSQALHDANTAIGKATAESMAELTKGWNTLWSNFKFVAVNVVSDIAKNGIFGKGGFAGSGDRALAKLNEVRGTAEKAAEKAEAYQRRIFNIQRLISDSSQEWSQTEAEIAELKRIAWDTTNDTVTRQEALVKAVELTEQRYEDEYVLRGRLANMQEKMNALTESSLADIEKANLLRTQEDNVLKTMNEKLKEMSEKQKTLAEEAKKEADARELALLNAEKLAQRQAEAQSLIDNRPGAIDTPNRVEALEVPGIIKPKLDKSDVIDITNELQQMMTTSFEQIGNAIGGLIGDLATGGDAWGNFADLAISAFADLAAYVGKVAIAMGTAVLGIDKALKTPGQGAVAIAAGVALIAISAAVRSALSNVTSGSYSASSGVASASGSYGSSSSGFGTGFETREMTVKVTGTLRADGNQLLTVIENENKRKNHTT